MGTMFKFFRFLILIPALLPLSCVTRLQPPKGLSSLNETNSIVFGKLEVTVNDKLVDPKPSIFHPVMQCLISPYISNDKLNRNVFAGGEYALKLPINKNGYFSFVIPPGKYYFVELEYLWLFSAYPNLGLRTYMLDKPFCVTFDAPTNRIAYIGTIRSDFQTDADNPLYFKASLSVAVTNNFAGASRWFFQSNPGFGTNVIERDVDITPL